MIVNYENHRSNDRWFFMCRKSIIADADAYIVFRNRVPG